MKEEDINFLMSIQGLEQPEFDNAYLERENKKLENEIERLNNIIEKIRDYVYKPIDKEWDDILCIIEDGRKVSDKE